MSLSLECLQASALGGRVPLASPALQPMHQDHKITAAVAGRMSDVCRFKFLFGTRCSSACSHVVPCHPSVHASSAVACVGLHIAAQGRCGTSRVLSASDLGYLDHSMWVRSVCGCRCGRCVAWVLRCPQGACRDGSCRVCWGARLLLGRCIETGACAHAAVAAPVPEAPTA